MSLTSELKNSASPIRAFLDGLSAPLTLTYGTTKSSQAAAEKLGFVELINRAVSVPRPEKVDASSSGTAFDIRTRIALGNFELAGSASERGLAAIAQQANTLHNGEHRARIITELYAIAQNLMAVATTEEDLDLASILLTPPEQFYRGNMSALPGSLSEALDAVEDARAFIDALDPHAIEDIRTLRTANAEQIVAWREQIDAGEPFEGNPSFIGSLLVGGADGDWLAGDTLIDCKVYAKLTIARLRDFLRQLLGYVMLDLDDTMKIRSVGVWLPRQVTMHTWSLEALLGGDPEVLLPKLREDFVKSTRRTQLAVHVPVTEQRKLQLVADNRFSPTAMLRTLAYGDDLDLRFRVGRNLATPVDMIRMLSEDHYARVREAVAKNGSTPVDVLARLATDTSVMVRRAAAGNPGAPAVQPQALAQSETLSVSTTDAVVLTAPADQSVSAEVFTINQNRDVASHDYRLLADILYALSDHAGPHAARIKLPEASVLWAWRGGRKPEVPEWLRADLPRHVVESMFDSARPPYIRLIAARRFPVDDPVTRERLFADDDVDIRWDALQRSRNCTDEALRDFLSELASSRPARLAFRMGTETRSYDWRRPADYDEDVLELLAGHPATPPAVLRTLVEQKSADVLLALAGNPALDDEGADLLAERIMQVRSTESRLRFVQSVHCPVVVLEKLSHDRSADVRLGVAENRYTPETTLERLAHAGDSFMKTVILENPSTPTVLAQNIADHLLATTRDEPLSHALSACEYRQDLQLSEELIEAALDRLSKSRVRNPDLREYVADDHRTSEKTLTRLARSADEHVRLAVAGNDRTPQDTLSILLRDDSLRVRVAAYRGIDVAADDEDDSEESTELEVQTKATPKSTIAELREMAANKRADVRKSAAYSSEATPDILRFLAGDRRSVNVRRAAAAHPNTPADVLWSLASDSDAEISQILAFSGATPVGLLAELAGRRIDLALLVALNPDAPEDILGALADDGDELVRFVAQKVVMARHALSVGGVTATAQGELPVAGH